MSRSERNIDPLFQLFERYLMTRSYDDSEKFMKELAKDYMAYLDSTSAHVPFFFRKQLLDDLETEIKELLTRKLYGCINPDDYRNFGQVIRVETIRMTSRKRSSKKLLPAPKRKDTELFETLHKLLLPSPDGSK